MQCVLDFINNVTSFINDLRCLKMLLMNRCNNRSENVPSQIVFPMTLFSYCNIPGKYQLILHCASSTLHRVTSKFRIIFCTSEIYESKSKSGDILEGSLTLMQ